MLDDERASFSTMVGLFAISLISFYVHAVVTEERLLPALNVISTKLSIPYDVAGATIMAAGASAPVFFVSAVALFVANSPLGLGTILGSEVFNQLVVCSLAVFASKTGTLELDRAVVSREVFFYGTSVCFLWYVLHDVAPIDGDDEEHLFISFVDACLLVSGYVMYVVACINYDSIVTLFSCTVPGSDAAVHLPQMRHDVGPLDSESFGKSGISDPVSNFANSLSISGAEQKRIAQEEHDDEAGRLLPTANRNDPLYDGVNSSHEPMSCLLWQRSFFYDKCKVATHGWNLRRFTLSSSSVQSVLDEVHLSTQPITYPDFKNIEVDPDRLIMKVIPSDSRKSSYYLMAPDPDVFAAVVKGLNQIIDAIAIERGNDCDSSCEDAQALSENSHSSFIDFPQGKPIVRVAFHILLFPTKALLHYTVPDVRVLDGQGMPKPTLSKAFAGVVMSLVWLAIASCATVASLGCLAVSPVLVGLTVSAVGLSIPNIVASKAAARRGFGNMAILNALGLNTFSILCALGFPWIFYTSLATHFQPYDVLRNDGVLESVLFLLQSLVVFIVSVLLSGFKLCKWHAVFYIILYTAFLVSSVRGVYL